jgi:hypothetical protein
MKRFFTFFPLALWCAVLCAPFFLYASNQSYCDSFLTCVAIPEDYQISCQESFGRTFFSIRPQDSNSALRLTKIASEDHAKSWGIDVSFTAQQSFARNDNLLAQWFLFNGCSSITVGVPSDTRSFTVDGRQLGLLTSNGDTGPLGTLSLSPTIKNKNISANLWCDLSDCACGLWFRTYFTLVQATTALDMKSTGTNAALSGNYPNGMYTTECNDAPLQYTSICSAFVGDKAFGNIPALKYGKFYSDSKTKTALASIRTDLNYDIIESPCGFFNCGACVVIPTGNKPQGIYLFEPIIGANGSWQVGATLLGAYHYLQNPEGNSIDFYCDATATYLTKSKQTRVFSLNNNGAGSQYMLLKVFDLKTEIMLEGERAANILVGQSDIGGNYMFDASLMMHLTRYNGFSFDVGYNFWARTQERIANTTYLRKFAENTYGIKGNLPLSGIDSFSELCIDDMTTASNATLSSPGTPDDTTQVLTICDINFNAPLSPSAFSNKLFTSLGYSRNLCKSDSTINVFIEGEVEIGQKNRALNQWALTLNVTLSL